LPIADLDRTIRSAIGNLQLEITVMLHIRRAIEEDHDAIWEIFKQVVERGDSYAFALDTTRAEAEAFWLSPKAQTYVACDDDEGVGSYILRANQPGLGSHVANAGYMVRDDQQGKGVGRAMCEHSLVEARLAGFQAMQFNIVVSTNEAAVALWRKMGFSIVGTLPKAFRHKDLGLVDAYVMYRFL
jgi:ribosomal protein S18 acetylase RimI-like enzyme